MIDKVFEHFVDDCKQRVDTALNQQLERFVSDLSPHDNQHHLETLRQAMHYSVLNGGKRIRPLLIYAAAKSINANIDLATVDLAACSIEMIHSYSLIHDDLPAMDNDDLRRGKPTCHRQFDEATAILAGDGLNTFAFELLTTLNCDAQIRLKLIKTLSHAAGPLGMIGGQAIDLASVNQRISLQHLETLHQLKTGALIRAAVTMGGQLASANEAQLDALDDYAQAIGLAFQVQDDILDIESDTQTLGKQQGADIALNKPTYPSLLGLQGAKEKAQQLHQQALKVLECFDHHADPLRQLSAYIVDRRH